ncbi:DMT family transporter [Mycobacterium sp. 141]|uniref:DMT family transporter n=1 Tax=Mycobacterium sp. 141 TaxID=1120797 RepID=UPI001E43C353|nr:DMT family transporter [Mycobacterium sp. 141]
MLNVSRGLHAINERPVAAAAVGALGVSTSGLFVALSTTSPGTASFFRCVFALPVLIPLAVAERRHRGEPTARQHRWAAAAGVLFAADALFWTQAIYEVGVGLSAVLVNTQVVMVPLLARLIDREPLSTRFIALLPVVTLGTVLTGGIFESGVTGTGTLGRIHPFGVGRAVLLGVPVPAATRRAGPTAGPVVRHHHRIRSVRCTDRWCPDRWRHPWHRAGGPAGWLVLTAICGQVLGWLLVALSNLLLRVEVSSALLLLTPIGALLLAAVFLGQVPSVLQVIGCVLILGSACRITART